MAAKNGENVLSNGPKSQRPVSPPSLIDAIRELVIALSETNHMMLELIGQNAVLIDSLIDQEESDDEPSVDMAGYPIRVS